MEVPITSDKRGLVLRGQWLQLTVFKQRATGELEVVIFSFIVSAHCVKIFNIALTAYSSSPIVHFVGTVGESKSIDEYIYHLAYCWSMHKGPGSFAHQSSLRSMYNQVHIRQKRPVCIPNAKVPQFTDSWPLDFLIYAHPYTLIWIPHEVYSLSGISRRLVHILWIT